jgi:hypothetical protein
MAELLTADLELQARLHRYGLAEWVRRNNRDEMLRVAQGCVDALDKIQALEREIERLRAVETKATLPHGFTGLQAFDAYEWLRGVCEKEPDNDHAHVALGLWHHHATGGPVETTVQPDEKCGNCGDDYSKHLGERLICPDAAMPDIYRWTAEPTQVKAGG